MKRLHAALDIVKASHAALDDAIQAPSGRVKAARITLMLATTYLAMQRFDESLEYCMESVRMRILDES